MQLQRKQQSKLQLGKQTRVKTINLHSGQSNCYMFDKLGREEQGSLSSHREVSDSLDEQLLQTKQWLLQRTLNLQR